MLDARNRGSYVLESGGMMSCEKVRTQVHWPIKTNSTRTRRGDSKIGPNGLATLPDPSAAPFTKILGEDGSTQQQWHVVLL